MSVKGRASEKQIRRVFSEMSKKGISVKRNGNKMSNSTAETYTSTILTLFRRAQRDYGIKSIWQLDEDLIQKIFQEKMDDFHSGKTTEAWNMTKDCAALKAFNLGVRETTVFKRKFDVGDLDKLREKMTNQNIQRKSRTSTVLRATPNECLSVLENISKKKETNSRVIAYQVGKIGLETGGRISAILNLRAGDIFVDSRKATITYRSDKGGLTRTVEVSRETGRYLEQLIQGKKDTQHLFSLKKRDGTLKSVKSMRDSISQIFAEEGAHLIKTEAYNTRDKDNRPTSTLVVKKFSSHSFRKAFALERASQYLERFQKSKSATKNYISTRLNEDPKLVKKLRMVEERINQANKTPRNLTSEECAIFFTSVDLGHFRNDVITAFYADYKELAAYLLTKKE